jgi:hypothetical protein
MKSPKARSSKSPPRRQVPESRNELSSAPSELAMVDETDPKRPRWTKEEHYLARYSGFRAARAERLSEGTKGLLLVNGGGAAALLAFIQAIWKEERELAMLSFYAVGIMAFGLFLGMLVPIFRFHHSWSAEKKEQGIKYNPHVKSILRFSFQFCFYASAASFLAAVIFLSLCASKIKHDKIDEQAAPGQPATTPLSQ